MKELLVMLASVMPLDDIIEKLEDQIKEYKILKTEDSFKMILMYSAMILSKHATDNKDVHEVLEQMGRMDQAEKLLSPEKS